LSLFIIPKTSVVFVLNLLTDLGKLISWEISEKFPANIERFEDGSLLIFILGNELFFEPVMELEDLSIIWSKSFLTDDSLHGNSILTWA